MFSCCIFWFNINEIKNSDLSHCFFKLWYLACVDWYLGILYGGGKHSSWRQESLLSVCCCKHVIGWANKMSNHISCWFLLSDYQILWQPVIITISTSEKLSMDGKLHSPPLPTLVSVLMLDQYVILMHNLLVVWNKCIYYVNNTNGHRLLLPRLLNFILLWIIPALAIG